MMAFKNNTATFQDDSPVECRNKRNYHYDNRFNVSRSSPENTETESTTLAPLVLNKRPCACKNCLRREIAAHPTPSTPDLWPQIGSTARPNSVVEPLSGPVSRADRVGSSRLRMPPLMLQEKERASSTWPKANAEEGLHGRRISLKPRYPSLDKLPHWMPYDGPRLPTPDPLAVPPTESSYANRARLPHIHPLRRHATRRNSAIPKHNGHNSLS